MSGAPVSTICPFCGVGCGIRLHVSDGAVSAVEPDPAHPVSRGQLCAKGWNTAYGIAAGERVTTPLVRERGGLRPASWDEALALVAGDLAAFLADSGPRSVGVISSARATNEDNYAAQKFARAVLGTNNVDHCARICHSPSVAGLARTLGSGAMTNGIADIEQADVILVIGADASENHAILGGYIMRALERGARLIVVDPRRTRLARLAELHLQLKLGTNIALLNGMLHVIFSEGWENKAFLEERCTNVAALKAHVAPLDLGAIEDITGVPRAQLRRAAELYSRAERAYLAYGMGVTQFASGTGNVVAVADLALACGQIGRPGTGVNPLRGQNNVQGACDMGCLPDVYPGYQAAADPAVRAKFAAAWGTAVPEEAGLTSMGMTGAMLGGALRGLILMGEDPAVTDPDQNRIVAGLRALDLLVVVEMYLTETARLADVVLPAASFAEKDGTFTNCERRVQRVRQAVAPPGEARSDWRILALLAERLGSAALRWSSAREVFDEMAALTPSYSGMSYPLLERHHGLQWPCDAEHPLGSPVLHGAAFPIGKARLLPVDHTAPEETPDADYPLYFTTHRLHFQYGCGSMTRRSPLLERETPDGLLFMNPADGRALHLADHSPVGVRSRRGYVETRVVLSEEVPAGLVAMPYHFKEAPSNQLTNNALDPVSKMPELKACAVRVEPLPADALPRDLDAIREHRPYERL